MKKAKIALVVRTGRNTERHPAKSGGDSETEQHHKKACDINNIVAKYRRTGLLDHIAKHQGTYGDATGLDFQDAQNLIATQTSIFNELPAAVRAEFENDPAQYLELITSEGGPQELAEMLNPTIEEEVPEVEETPVEVETDAEPA